MMTFTTRLLEALDDRMPHRHQVIVAVLIVFLTVASMVGGVSSRPAVQAAPAVIILVATPTRPPAGAMGLAKRAAPQSGVSVLAAATVTPLPVMVVQPAPQAVETQPARRVGEKPSDKPGPGGE